MIAVGNISTHTFAGSSGSWTHNVGFGSYRYAIGLIQCWDPGATGTINSVSWGAAGPMVNQVATRNGTIISEIWSYSNPALGNTTVSVSLSTAMRVTATVISLNGVDNVVPFPATATNTGTNAAPTCNIGSAMNELVLDSMAALGGLTITATVGVLQTERSNLYRGTLFTGGVRGCTSTEPGAATVTMSWTLSFRQPWACAVLAVAPKVLTGTTQLPLIGVGQ